MQELKGQKSDTQTQKEMISMLKREASHSPPDSGIDDQLIHRFDDIDFDDESDDTTVELLSRLTAEERQQFEHMVTTGQVTSFMPVIRRDPWYLTFKPTLVTQASDKAGFGVRRDLINQLPELSAICGQKEPSVHLKYCLMNVLVSYCSACRHFNGERMSLADEFVDELLLGSAVLREGAVFQDTSTALHHCTQHLIQELHLTVEEVRRLFEDVRLIIQDKNLVLEVMADVWLAMDKCLSDKKPEKEKRVKLKLLQKKVQFLIAWCKKQELQSVAHEVDFVTAGLPVSRRQTDDPLELFVLK